MADWPVKISPCDPALTHRLLDQHTFAVINRLRQPKGLPGFHSVPLIPTGLDREAHLLPLLVKLNSPEILPNAVAALTENLTAALPESPVLMLVGTRDTPERLQGHLQHRLVVRLPGTGTALLRWYDPKVFIHLLNDFEPGQLRALFGAIDRITFLLNGIWYTALSPVTADLPKWTFNGSAAVKLADIKIVNAVLDSLDWRDLESLSAFAHLIRSSIEHARVQYGLHGQDDLVAFATQAVHIHPQFDKHAHLQSLLAGLCAPPPEEEKDRQSYADATDLMPDAVWQQIREEMHSTKEH